MPSEDRIHNVYLGLALVMMGLTPAWLFTAYQVTDDAGRRNFWSLDRLPAFIPLLLALPLILALIFDWRLPGMSRGGSEAATGGTASSVADISATAEVVGHEAGLRVHNHGLTRVAVYAAIVSSSSPRQRLPYTLWESQDLLPGTGTFLPVAHVFGLKRHEKGWVSIVGGGLEPPQLMFHRDYYAVDTPASATVKVWLVKTDAVAVEAHLRFGLDTSGLELAPTAELVGPP